MGGQGVAAAHVAEDPDELDIVFAASKHSLARILRGYEADLGLCTGFPWRISAEAIAVPPLGIVNGHPSLLPRYRGPFPIAWAVRNGETEIGLSYHLMDADFDTGNVLAQKPFPLLDDAFDRLARGDRGDPQAAGEYQGPFEEEYRFADLSRPAAEVHRQTRAWSFVPPILPRGPIVERDGETVRLVRTSLVEVEGAERLECAGGPLWVVESEPA